MSSAGFILAINTFVAAAFALAFLVVAYFDRARSAAYWFALTYASGMLYLTLEFVIAAFPSGQLAQVLVFASFLGSLVIFNIGLANKYSVEIPWGRITAVIIASLAIGYAIQILPRTSVSRSFLYQMPYFAMQMIGAGIVFAAKKRKMLDSLLGGLLIASALQFLTKPLLAELLGGNGAVAREYHTTVYALASQSLGTIFALLIALVTLMGMVSDLLSEAARESEKDALSGLLNRRGFERRAEAVLRDLQRKRQTCSVVLCDLDNFKLINDTCGHAAGDRTIKAFAKIISEGDTVKHLSGRMGGDEFAVALPGAGLFTARLFAEGARTALSEQVIAGVPGHIRCTASFGVAEFEHGEAVEELMGRADAALYEAKRRGRNQVRAAGPHLLDSSVEEPRSALG